MTVRKVVLGRNCQTTVNATRALGARRVSPLLPASWSRIGVGRGAVRNRAWDAALARFATGSGLIDSADVATFGSSNPRGGDAGPDCGTRHRFRSVPSEPGEGKNERDAVATSRSERARAGPRTSSDAAAAEWGSDPHSSRCPPPSRSGCAPRSRRGGGAVYRRTPRRADLTSKVLPMPRRVFAHEGRRPSCRLPRPWHFCRMVLLTRHLTCGNASCQRLGNRGVRAGRAVSGRHLV